MNPVNETALLLLVVIFGATVSAMSYQWTGSWSYLATFGGALLSGMSAGRITRIVRKATE